MPSSFLWVVDYHGSLYKLHLESNEWERVSRDNLNTRKDTFKRISSTKSCAWAIGGDQKVYMSVYQTDLPIRTCEECFENMRWSIRHGWSLKSFLPTDRWSWSSKDGKRERQCNSVKLPSSSWTWECDWFIDKSVECDIDGWQYAVDFPAHYYKKSGRLSFVKRRKWIRNRRFTGFNQWDVIESPSIQDPFQDITIGGYEIPGKKDGFLMVWAITFHGKVYYRKDIRRSNPEGACWEEISTNDINLVQISVGPSGLLWGCTWDGEAVVRTGITLNKPEGDSWVVVSPPLNTMLFQVAVGNNALWAITKDGKVFFRRGVDSYQNDGRRLSPQHSSGLSWVEMVGKFSFITIGPYEQVWAIGFDDRELCYRTNVTSEELVGREWKKFKIKQSAKNSKLNFHVDSMNISWINSGACDDGDNNLTRKMSSLSLSSSFSDEFEWRNELLQKLHNRNMMEIKSMNEKFVEHNMEINSELTEWSKRSQCQLLVDIHYDIWCSCYIKLQNINNNNKNISYLFLYYKQKDIYEEINFPIHSITCLHRIQYASRSYVFKIQQNYISDTTVTVSMETEEEFFDWLETLSLKEGMEIHAYDKNLTSSLELFNGNEYLHIENTQDEEGTVVSSKEEEEDYTENSINIADLSTKPVDETAAKSNTHESNAVQDNTNQNKLWITSTLGDVFHSNPSSLQNTNIYWFPVKGNMKTVITGCDDITWGISFDGKAYVFNEGKKYHEQCSLIQCYIYENQRWNPVEGYSDRRLPSDRWSWSDETGVYNCAKDQYKLPSTKYKWVTPWSIDYQENADQDAWQYAVDFPRYYHKWRGVHDYVRRRRWKRSCKVTCYGPWVEVPTDVKIRDLSISVNQPIGVWVVSCNGDLLVRKNVTKENPQGTSWECIVTDVPVLSVSICLNNRVWCSAKDGSCLLRAGYNENTLYGSRWFDIPKEDILITGLSVGNDVIVAIDNKGIFYIRCEVKPTYPEGTKWKPVLENVTCASVNRNDQIYFIQNAELKWCTKDNNDDLIQIKTLLKSDWLSVCAIDVPNGLNSKDAVDARTMINTEAKSLTKTTIEISSKDSSEDLNEMISNNAGLRENEASLVEKEVSLSENETVVNPYRVDIYNLYATNETVEIDSLYAGNET